MKIKADETDTYQIKRLKALQKTFPEMTEEAAIVCIEVHSMWNDHKIKLFDELILRLSTLRDDKSHKIHLDPSKHDDWWDINHAIYRTYKKGHLTYSLGFFKSWGTIHSSSTDDADDYDEHMSIRPVIVVDLKEDIKAVLNKIEDEENERILSMMNNNE
jgi:hypothetical protein